MGDLTRKLFTDHLSLEFIYIATRGNFEAICNAIHIGLCRSQKEKRERLEIGFHLDCTEIGELADFMCNVSKIVLTLSGSNIKQWMVTLDRNNRRGQAPFSFKQ